MRKNIGIVLAVLFVFQSPVFSEENKEEKKSSKLEIIGKTHSIFAFNTFSGAGAGVKNLANTYDMSIFEFSWGGKQSTFNGSGITTNANYPLTDGEAFSTNTQLGLSSEISKDMKAGFLVEMYALAGDRTVGRVFGEEMPWNDFPRDDSRAIKPHRFNIDLYNAFLEGKHEDFQYKLVGGTLTPRELPEFTRKEMNEVKLGSLVYRAPITNASFFEKEDRKIEEGRHPLRGFDFIGDYEYLDEKHMHIELFTGNTRPTPIFDIERDAFGGRASFDVEKGNIGLTYVYNQGIRQGSVVEENQGVWAVDSSYKLYDWLIPYFTFARTNYERENTKEAHQGNAYVAGVLIKLPKKYELRPQYQRVEENYDLMAYHKTEHYPSNFHGFNVQATAPLTDTFKLKGVLYHLQQLDTNTDSGDTIFGDSFFPSVVLSKQGTIDVQRVSADWQMTKPLSLNTYVEHAKFYKEADTTSTSIDKDVYNFYGGATLALHDKVNLECGFRRFLSFGDWQTMSFDSFQNIPEVAISYKIDKDHHAYLIYHYYDFEDENIVSQGKNDYYGYQILAEIKIPL